MCKVTRPLSGGGHQHRRVRRVAVARPLIVHEKLRAVAKQVRDAQGSAERCETLHLIEGRFGRRLAGQRIWGRIEDRVIHCEADIAVVQRASTTATVAERLRLRKRRGRAIVDASVNQQSIGGSAREVTIGIRRGRRCCGFLGLIRFGGRTCRGLQVHAGDRCRARGAQLDHLRFHFRNGKHGEFKVPCRYACRQIVGNLGKSRHFHFDLPSAVRQVGERIGPLGIGDRRLSGLLL